MLYLSELCVGLIDSGLHRREHVGVVRKIFKTHVLFAICSSPHRCGFWVEHEQSRHELSVVTDCARLANNRNHLERSLKVCRADVLATGGDDELFLTIDDLQIALVIESSDVAGVEPAVVIEHFSGLIWGLEIPLEDVAAAGQHFAFVTEFDFHARADLSDEAGLICFRAEGERTGRL